jgi:hypothetical protein
MGQRFDFPKFSRAKGTKHTSPAPSCRQLAERFVQLQRLRQEVRAAESEQKQGQTNGSFKTSRVSQE